MIEEITTNRTPELIGAEIRTITQQAKYMALLYGVEVGRRLNEAKELLPHGQWLPWLEKETEFSPATASRFMKLFDEYGADQGSLFGAETNSSTLKNISISNALRLLTIPRNERESFAVEHDVEHMSTRELDALLKEKENAEKRAETAEKAAADLEQKANEWSEELIRLRAENKELSNRPVETVIEKDEKAIIDAAEAARKKAEKEWGKKLKDAEIRYTKQQEAFKAAQTRAEGAAAEHRDELTAARNAAEAAKRELEEVKKQLRTADADTVAFKIYFKNVQEDFTLLAEIIKKVKANDAEQANKLCRAVKAVIENCTAELEG